MKGNFQADFDLEKIHYCLTSFGSHHHHRRRQSHPHLNHLKRRYYNHPSEVGLGDFDLNQSLRKVVDLMIRCFSEVPVIGFITKFFSHFLSNPTALYSFHSYPHPLAAASCFEVGHYFQGFHQPSFALDHFLFLYCLNFNFNQNYQVLISIKYFSPPCSLNFVGNYFYQANQQQLNYLTKQVQATFILQSHALTKKHRYYIRLTNFNANWIA